jgi:hypothetical protein
VGEGYLEMVEQVSLSDISGAAVALMDILVMFLVPCTAQVMTNKIANHQLPIFCEQREWLEKTLNSRGVQKKGHQVFRCVHFLLLYLNLYEVLLIQQQCSVIATFT